MLLLNKSLKNRIFSLSPFFLSRVRYSISYTTIFFVSFSFSTPSPMYCNPPPSPKRPEKFFAIDCGSSSSSSKRISVLYLHHVKKLSCFVSTKWEEKAIVSWRKLVWGFSVYWYVSVFFYLYLHSPSVQDFSWNIIWLTNRPLTSI